jgi:predicted aspartyl protease
MRSIADQLPPEIAKQIHPDWRKNEADYWAVRDELLAVYKDQWIGFANGQVVVSGKSPVRVLHAARRAAAHPFVICVGREQEPSRVRRSAFPYDTNYIGESLPLLDVEFRQNPGAAGIVFDRVIPDTGADTSILPWIDCQALQLDPNQATPGYLSGVAGGSVASIVFDVWVELDGNEYPCRVHADPIGTERILGRDVLNWLNVLFRGPACEVVVNP